MFSQTPGFLPTSKASQEEPQEPAIFSSLFTVSTPCVLCLCPTTCQLTQSGHRCWHQVPGQAPPRKHPFLPSSIPAKAAHGREGQLLLGAEPHWPQAFICLRPLLLLLGWPGEERPRGSAKWQDTSALPPQVNSLQREEGQQFPGLCWDLIPSLLLLKWTIRKSLHFLLEGYNCKYPRKRTNSGSMRSMSTATVPGMQQASHNMWARKLSCMKCRIKLGMVVHTYTLSILRG